MFNDRSIEALIDALAAYAADLLAERSRARPDAGSLRKELGAWLDAGRERDEVRSLIEDAMRSGADAASVAEQRLTLALGEVVRDACAPFGFAPPAPRVHVCSRTQPWLGDLGSSDVTERAPDEVGGSDALHGPAFRLDAGQTDTGFAPTLHHGDSRSSSRERPTTVADLLRLSSVATLTNEGTGESTSGACHLWLADVDYYQSMVLESQAMPPSPVRFSIRAEGRCAFYDESAQAREMHELRVVSQGLPEFVARVEGELRARRARRDLAPGDLIAGKYRVETVLGRGGFGVVYKARDERLMANVAVKVLPALVGQPASERRAFRAEAQRVTKLSHPNIVEWKAYDENPDGSSFFVMEYIHGEDLASLLHREKRLQPARAARLLLQILDALRAAHSISASECILHLDLKPSNVFVLPGKNGVADERVKVIDFGIGQHIGGVSLGTPQRQLASTEAQGKTDLHLSSISLAVPATHQGAGVRRCRGCTPEYSSPEQCSHFLPHLPPEPLDSRSDLYSLGVLAFQMLAGELPFDRPDERWVYLKLHREVQPRTLQSFGVSAPRRMVAFIDRCLAKRPADRWSSTEDAYQALLRATTPFPWKLAAAVSLPLASVAALFLLLQSDRPAATNLLGLEILNRPGQWISAPDTIYFGEVGERREIRVDPPRGATELRFAPVLASSQQPIHYLALGPVGSSDSLQLTLTAVPGQTEHMIVGFAENGDVVVKSKPFLLGLIRAGDWEIEGVTIEGVKVEDDRSVDSTVVQVLARRPQIAAAIRLVNPSTTQIDVIREANFYLNNRTTTGIRPSPTTDGALDATHSFPDPPMGVVECRVEVLDVTGRKKERRVRVEFLKEALSSNHELLVNGQRSSTIYAHQSAELSVHLNRPARLHELKLSCDGIERAPPDFPSAWSRADSASHVLNLNALLKRYSEQAPFSGRLSLVFVEPASVIHDVPQRGQAVADVKFDYSSAAARLECKVNGEVLVAGRDERRLFRVGDHLELRVHRVDVAGAPTRAKYRWRNLSDPQDVRPSIPITEFENPSRGVSERIVLPLDAAGRWRLEFAQWLDGDSEPTELPRVAEFEASNSLPSLQRVNSVEPLVFKGMDDPLRVVEFQATSGDSIVPVRVTKLEWVLFRVARAEASGPEDRARSGSVDVDPDSRAAITLPLEGLSDGCYRLDAWAVDELDRRSPTVPISAVRAFAGPMVSVSLPVDVWEPSAADRNQWKIEFGVSSEFDLKPPLVDLRGPSPDLVADAYVRPRTTGGASFDAFFQLDERWSGASVELRIRAEDAHNLHVRTEILNLPVIAATQLAEGISYVARGDIPEYQSEMVLVTGNRTVEFKLGGRGSGVEAAAAESKTIREWFERSPSSQTVHPVAPGAIADFYLDRYEATHDEFMSFARSPGGYRNPSNWSASGGSVPSGGAAYWEALSGRDGEQPVYGVTLDEAAAYASWTGRRLPSLAEFEWAFRGGVDYRLLACCTKADEQSIQVALAGINYRRDLSSEAWALWTRGVGGDSTPRPWPTIANLSGNVSEWTASPRAVGGLELPDCLVSPRRIASEITARLTHFYTFGASARHTRPWFLQVDEHPRDWRPDGRRILIGFRCALDASAVAGMMKTVAGPARVAPLPADRTEKGRK